MNMIEKVARALHDSLYKDTPKDENTEQDYLEMKASFMDDARAATREHLLAEMIDAAKNGIVLGYGDDAPEDVWPYMIDAALKE